MIKNYHKKIINQKTNNIGRGNYRFQNNIIFQNSFSNIKSYEKKDTFLEMYNYYLNN